jgi:SAM-dependent methyltransferase
MSRFRAELVQTRRSFDYRWSHFGPHSYADGYDEKLFGPGQFEAEVWRAEQDLLDRFLRECNVPNQRYLDFACGTGRIVTYLESRFAESVGLDISPSMLDIARQRVRRTQLVCGDGTRDAQVVDGRFDCITAFRFFLNAQPALRDEAMQFLASKLRDSSSVLIFNIHRNACSTAWPIGVINKLRRTPIQQMTFWQVRKLVERHGLQIVAWEGIGYLDQAFYSRMPKKLWSAIEAAMRRVAFLKAVAVGLYFVCQLRTTHLTQSSPLPSLPSGSKL